MGVPEFHFRDRGLYLPESNALVIADLHVGRDRTSNVEFPLGERSDLTDRLAGLLDRFEPAEVVVAGDLLHSFDSVPEEVPETVTALREEIQDAGATLTVTPGNHDGLLNAVYDGPRTDEYRLADGDTVALHGHEEPTTGAGCYVVGHDHPAIEIEGRRRHCLLVGAGTYRGSDVLMVPAFSRLPAGTPLNGASGSDLRSPLVRALDAYRPVVYDGEAEETLEFPPLGQFRRML